MKSSDFGEPAFVIMVLAYVLAHSERNICIYT